MNLNKGCANSIALQSLINKFNFIQIDKFKFFPLPNFRFSIFPVLIKYVYGN